MVENREHGMLDAIDSMTTSGVNAGCSFS